LKNVGKTLVTFKNVTATFLLFLTCFTAFSQGINVITFYKRYQRFYPVETTSKTLYQV